MKPITVTYTTTRNTRFAAEKGKFNCEAMNGKSYIIDAQGDTAKEAKTNCERKINALVKAGRIVIK